MRFIESSCIELFKVNFLNNKIELKSQRVIHATKQLCADQLYDLFESLDEVVVTTEEVTPVVLKFQLAG
jgi:hypothetical protein